MTASAARAGYTLPVFACAAAVAALRCLRGRAAPESVELDLIRPERAAEIAIEQAAPLPNGEALAIARSEPGDNLDLTRSTPVWALVGWQPPAEAAVQPVRLEGGEGIGRRAQAGGEAAIYGYARQLIERNLARELAAGEGVRVAIVLPQGRQLAERTSNAAFGVLEGLSLLGTSGIAHPTSAPERLQACRAEVEAKAARFNCLAFCIGENGLDLAQQWGLNPEQLVKTANWLGPLLVAAGAQGLSGLLLVGYHGKLIKLAGGIFHTHHHLADGRLETLAAYGVRCGLPLPVLQALADSATAEAALQQLRQRDSQLGTQVVAELYGRLAAAIDRRAQAYIRNYAQHQPQVGSLLFDRGRQAIASSTNARHLWPQLC